MKATCVQFSVPFPVSVNSLWMPLYGRVCMRPEARAYKAKLVAGFKAHGLPCEPFGKADRLAVHYVLFEPDQSRDRDVANYEKLLTDALQEAGLFPNDSQIDDNRQTRGGIDAERPRVEVYITTIEPGSAANERSAAG